ncbi:OB-fold domain-containing protein [Streptomyces asoensis]|uniref:bifunctional MaoC family dehydratase N-terminal/OB-fold nucleic acid binding domain-containing protein n=1 Tax=Streptomyces asoensis TaxID=249586 RepID=UPI0033CA9E30
MDDELHARLKAYEGRPAAVAGVGRDPVNAPMIRHWCEAMGDRNPAYTGPDAIAPPTMLQAWIMGGLGGHGRRAHAYNELLSLLDDVGCTSIVATDCEQEYTRALRPGDEVVFDTVIESVSPRKTTKLGTGHFVTTRTDVRVGEALVGTHRFRVLKYAPAPGGRGPQPRQPERPGEARDGKASQARDAKASRARPRPVVNRDNAGFWEGVRRGRLLVQRCTACDTLRFPWLPGCNACGSERWDTVRATGDGTVFSYVVMHHPSFPAFDPPYAVVLVELAEGVRVVSNVVDVPYDKVRIGMPVELEFRTYGGGDGAGEGGEELVLPVFRPRSAEVAP